MSKQALEWVSENLPTVRRAKFTDSSGKVRPIGENGLALLWYLCDRTNSAGCFFMQARTMADETDLHLSAVKRLLAGFEQLGWVTRTGELVSYEGRGTPTPEYSLTLVPGLTKKATATRTGIPTGHPTGSPGDTYSETNANNGAEKSFSDSLQPEPQPQTQPHPHNGTGPERDQRPGGKAREWGERHAQVLAKCLSQEDMSRDKGGLRAHLESVYRPIIEQALRDHPGLNIETLARQCVATKKGTPTPTAKVEGQAGCETCHGTGYWQEPTGPYHYCPCTGQPDATHKDTPERTQERVTTEEGTNTEPPAPGATADPRSDHVSDLAKRLRRVV